mmetsp:Transcript_2402/g.4626  ORF Transcript_2402/g.4626 Transcript_2402/m.4626 type:complete len:102 (+) Transcript_2402:2-307(+)
MTDGCANDSVQAGQILNSCISQFPSTSGFQAHVIGFGSEASQPMLRELAGGYGTIHTAKIGQLSTTFQNICSNANISAALYTEIGDKIASQIKTQLADDFL